MNLLRDAMNATAAVDKYPPDIEPNNFAIGNELSD
jgi:hypothetical protein